MILKIKTTEAGKHFVICGNNGEPMCHSEILENPERGLIDLCDNMRDFLAKNYNDDLILRSVRYFNKAGVEAT